VGRESDLFKPTFLKNPPLANSGGFFISPLWPSDIQPAPSHMKTDTATPARELPTKTAPETRAHLVTVLSGIYLRAGLPLDAAVRAAIADYRCSFTELPSAET
jgi:hypothetical protein